ncbi:MAG: hypothetical protein Q8N15_05320 [Bacillota bacterium]|nr:hypothetical protein [Bacillota bacterium]
MPTIVVPAGSLSVSGSVGIAIVGQYIVGDPFFENESYCSSSSVSGPTVYCTLK